MKKRITAAVLAAAMTLSLGACSGSGQTQGAGSSQAEDAGGRQAGDTIAFPGCTKSLKKYLNERQVPPEKRAAWPLLCQGHQVLWLCGLEASLTAAPQAATAAFIIFEFQEEDHA